MWIEVLPKKIIQDKVIISKNMNCPKKKNSVNANKSNIKNKNCIWEEISDKNFMAEKCQQDQTNPPVLPVHQGYTQQKKKSFKQHLNYRTETKKTRRHLRLI